jgi:uncharacterized RDD family membrane protein YckC
MNTTNPYAPPQAAVQDVADSGATSEPAGRGARLAAAFLDGIFFALLVYVPLIFAVRVQGHPVVVNAHVNYGAMFGPVSLLGLIGLIAWAWLTILFVTRNGQSIAKKLLGIKVVRTDGSPASLGRIFLLRNVVNGLLALLPFYGLVDILLIFGEARQCVHDKIADTIVIKA